MKPKKPILKIVKDGKKIYSIGPIMIDAQEEQGWRIPLKKEIENEKIDYRYVWVCDKIKEDGYPEEFYAYQMNTRTKELIPVNKKFMEHCVVMKLKK